MTAVGRSFSLFLLRVNGMFLGDWVVLFCFVLLAWGFFVLIIVGCVVDMTLPDALFVAF